MQQLRDKLAIAERTAKAEAQLKVSSLLLSSPAFVISSVEPCYSLLVDSLHRRNINYDSRFWKKNLKHLVMVFPELKEEALAMDTHDASPLVDWKIFPDYRQTAFCHGKQMVNQDPFTPMVLVLY